MAILFFRIFVLINTIKKYLFSLIVTSYVVTVIGIPVYLHYCGGELEEISYLTRVKSCCGGEEDDSEEAENDCCKDENFVLKSNTDFTIKHINTSLPEKTVCSLFYISPSLYSFSVTKTSSLVSFCKKFPPDRLQTSLLISTSVLRI